jgi:hypothetical protein
MAIVKESLLPKRLARNGFWEVWPDYERQVGIGPEASVRIGSEAWTVTAFVGSFWI